VPALHGIAAITRRAYLCNLAVFPQDAVTIGKGEAHVTYQGRYFCRIAGFSVFSRNRFD